MFHIYCSQLTSVTFGAPSNLTDIPDRLFHYRALLKGLNHPDYLVKVAGSAFIDTSRDSFTARGFSTTGSLFMHMGTIMRCLGRPKSLRIPSTVREIGESAFAGVYCLEDLSFEEVVERIKSSAFAVCRGLKPIAFPVFLLAIDERAFCSCHALHEVTHAADSKLQFLRKDAFLEFPLERVFLPARVTEIDPNAFSHEFWPILKFDRPPPLLVTGDLLCSLDSGTILKCLSRHDTVDVPARIEVIGKNTFDYCPLGTVIFRSGSRLREIGKEAFCHSRLSAFTVPSSVEILGDRSFADCEDLSAVTFEEGSKLKTIGERAFAFSQIKLIAIPASVNEIDGSAFVGCPLEEIDIDPGNRLFLVWGNALLTSDGREIVRSFSREREIFVSREVEVLRKSCFESLKYLTELKFAIGSKLRRISRSALTGCDSLRCIVMPSSVTEIEEFAFKDCFVLEECSIPRDAILTKIGEAFAGCSCLRLFYVPKNAEGIEENFFTKCRSLFRLMLGSGDTLKRIMKNRTLDEVLENLGITEISSLFRIEVEEDGSDLSFPGWISVDDESSHLTLARDFS
jgi:hypothetical protein